MHRSLQLKSVIVTLVLSCTVSEILQVFVPMTPPLFHPNFGGVPVGPYCHIVAVNVSKYLEIFVREIIFEVFQPM